MTAVLRAEVLKLRTLRGSWLLLAAAQLIVIGGISGLVLSGGRLGQAATTDTAFSHVGLGSLCALLLGIFAVAGEYRHKTITDTYLSTPRRGRALAAKLAVYALAGTGIAVVSSVTALLAALAWWGAKGVSLGLADAGVWRTIAGGIAWNAAFAALGVCVGALVRNLAGAIAAALAWIALVETIVGQLIGSSASRWLPFTAGEALGRVSAGANPLPQWAAAAVLAGYVLVLGAGALWVTVRGDVT